MKARLVCAIIVTLLCACNARLAETRDPSTVVCAWISGPDGYDPVASTSSASRMMEDVLYTPLLDMGTASMLPNYARSLATRIDIEPGGTRYVIHIRRNLRWSDGAPLDARDVVFAIRLYANPDVIASASSDFTLMRSVRAIDAERVEVVLARPSPPFLTNALGEVIPLPHHILGRYDPGSVQEAQYVNTEKAFSQNPVVSGAWRITSSSPDSYVIVRPNDRYWGPRPRVNSIAFRVYPEQDSLFAAVAAGEVDVTDIPPDLWRVHDRLKGNFRFVTWPWNVAFTLVPNYRDPTIGWIADPRIKAAMMYAIDRQFIVSGILSGQADLLNGPLPPFSPYYDARIATYAYDPARARRLLDAAGWKMVDGVRSRDGKTLRITLKTGGATDAIGASIAELIQANLRSVGIDCELENEELQTFFQDELSDNFQLALRGIILPPYPDDYKYYGSSQTRPRGSNEGSFADAEIDRLLVAARTAPSGALARRALDRYQEVASRKLPVLFLYSNRLGAIVPSDLRGYVLTPLAPAALPMGVDTWRRQRR